ncbi:Uma2 family endonuclease [Nonomuraea phyllanthi]|uniref:Uma2 family endonuclease n=1 Tax=Nonomuraea phyllanthi TaxID=2219224 RepID=UPI001293D2E7|nr:Uma2 family endonuclease [Nonomuraea phyllanthi]QFY10744.1 Uma2 family endonuclease [Nonomuraea phyllanthi]
MVMASRRRPCRLTPETDATQLPATARELFDALPPLPGLRAEVIDERLIVSPVSTPEHARLAMLIHRALIPLLTRRGWDAFAGNVDVCIDGPRTPVEPDFVVAPPDCPRWGVRELLSSGLLMVAEVVSPSSAEDDRVKKPPLYAAGGVPVMLLVDPIAVPPTVTVLSDAKEGEYQTVTRIAMGSTVRIPDPIGLDLDTAIFSGSQHTP